MSNPINANKRVVRQSLKTRSIETGLITDLEDFRELEPGEIANVTGGGVRRTNFISVDEYGGLNAKSDVSMEGQG